MSNEEEKLQSRLTEIIISSSDPEELKNKVVKEIAISLNAYRCFFLEYDSSKNQFKKIINAYNQTREAQSMLGFDAETNIPNLAMKQKYMKSIVIEDTDEYIEKKQLTDSKEDIFFKEFNVKSLIDVRLEFGENFLGVFTVHYDKTKPPGLNSHLIFLKNIAEHISIALYLSTLYTKEKQAFNREKLQGEIIETIRSSLDINEVFLRICEEVAKAYKVERVTIVSFPEEKNYKKWIIREEYKSKKEIKGISDIKYDIRTGEYNGKVIIEEGRNLIINNVPESNTPDYFKKNYTEMGAKSVLSVPIQKGKEIWGLIYLTKYDDFRHWTEEEITLLESISDQIYISIKQAELYEKEKQTTEREKLLRKVIESLQKAPDLKAVKQEIVDEVGKAFNADRCYIRVFNKFQEESKKVDAEYLSSADIPTIKDFTLIKEIHEYFYKRALKAQKPYVIKNTEEYIKKHRLQDSSLDKYFTKMEIKSDYPIPIWDNENNITYLVLHFVKKPVSLSEEEINFLKTIAVQTSNVISQSLLYEQIKQTAEREKILRSITDTIRSSLDIHWVKKKIVTEMRNYFNADRCQIISFDPIKDEFITLDEESEALSSDKTLSSIGFNWNSPEIRPLLNKFKKREDFCYSNLEDYLRENNLYDSLQEKVLRAFNMNATYNFPIFYADNFMGFLGFDYENYIEIDQADINLMKSVAIQAGIAIHQANIYEKEKHTAERERVLREIISTVNSTFNLDDIFSIICIEISKTFNVDRLSIVKFLNPNDPTNNLLMKEYKTKTEYKEVKDSPFFDELGNFWTKKLLVTKEPLSIENIKKANVPDIVKEAYMSMGVKSIIGIPIIKGDEVWGGLYLSQYDNYRHWTEEEINLLESISAQVYIAINQAELFEKEKQTAERETILRTLIETIQGTFNFREIFNTVAAKLAQVLNVERITITEFLNKDNLEEHIIHEEYKSSEEIKGIDYKITPKEKKIAKFWGNWLLKEKSYISVNSIEEADVPDFFKDFYHDLKIKSILIAPILRQNDLWGMIAVSKANTYKTWTEEEKKLLEAVADNFYVTIKQAELYEKEKQTAERERLLREIIETIRSSLDINEVLNIICDEVAKAYGVERATLIRYPEEKKYKEWDIKREFKARDNIKGLKDIDYDERNIEYLGNIIVREGKNFIVDKITEFDAPDYFKKNYEELGVKSILCVPIQKGDDKWGFIYLSEYDDYRHWTEEEINLLESITDQIYIAIKQAELFEKEKQATEREKLLREVITTVRSTLDLNKIFKTIGKEISMAFNADRVHVVEIADKTDYSKWVSRYEFLADKSFSGAVKIKKYRKIGIFWCKTTLDKEQNIIIDNIQKSDYPDFFKDFYTSINAKSIIGLPIKSAEDKWGILILCQYRNYRHWSEEEINLLESITDQIYIAINQAELFKKEKQTAERETILRTLIETIQGTFNFSEIFNTVAVKLAQVFNVERIAITEFPIKDNLEEYIIHEEYKSSEEIKGISDNNTPESHKVAGFLGNRLLQKKSCISINSIEEADVPDFFKDFYIDKKVKSILIAPILRQNDLWGMIAVSKVNTQKTWAEEEKKLLGAVADNFYVAIKQAELYEKEKETAERERLLRNTTETLRSTLDLQVIKLYLVNTIGSYFNADRCHLQEYDTEKNSYLPTDAEYLSSPDIKSIKNIDASILAMEFASLIKGGKNTIIKDVEQFIKENRETMPASIQFLITHGIKSDYGFGLFYQDKYVGTVVVSYIKEKKELSNEELDFLQSLVNSTGAAIYQAQLLEKEKQTAERELLLRQVIESIRSTLNINKLKKIITETLGKALDLDRCFIVLYAPLKNTYSMVDEYSEFRSSEAVKSVVDFDFSTKGLNFFVELGKKDIDTYGSCTETDFVGKYGTEITPEIKDYFDNFSVKSCFQNSLFYGEEFLGILVGHKIEKREEYTNEEKALIKSFTNQTAIAIHQAKLYQTVQQTAERERLLREVTATVISSIDFNESKKTLLTRLSKTFDCDFTVFYIQDIETNKFIPVDKYSVYLSSSEIESPIGINLVEKYGWGDYFRSEQITELVYSDIEDFKRDYNIYGTLGEEFLEKYNIKSTIAIPVKTAGQLLGILVMNYTRKHKIITPQDVNIIRTVAEQAGIALYRSILYEKEKQTAERETLLREIIETIRSSLDINEVLTIICDEVAKAYGVERATLIRYPEGREFKEWDIKREFKARDDIKGIKDIDYDERNIEYLGNIVVREGKDFIVDNIAEFDTPDYFKKNYEELGVKSILSIPIQKGDDKWGFIYLSEYDNYRHWTEEEINLLKSITDQVYIAIKQAELFEKEKQTAEREKLLRKIIEAIRSSLDSQKIKKYLVNSICAYFNADRCFISEYDSEKDDFPPVSIEYLSSSEIKSILYKKISEEAPEFTNIVKSGKSNIIKDSDFFIEENKEVNLTSIKFIKSYGIKSDYGFGLFYQNQYLGALVVHFVKEKKELKSDEIDFLQLLANQMGTALYQANLYEKEKQTAEREKLLRETIETLRSTLDIDKTKKMFVESIGEYLEADRCGLSEYDHDKNIFIPIKYEHLSSPDVTSMVGYNPAVEAPFISKNLTKGIEHIEPDEMEFIKKNNLQNTIEEKEILRLKVKSSYAVTIFYIDKLYGFIFAHYTKTIKQLSEEQLEILRISAAQAGIALYQAQLYEKQKDTAERERLLREIIETTRSTLDINVIKASIASSVGKVFNADRCFYIEFDTKKNLFEVIKNEYLSENETLSIKGFDINVGVPEIRDIIKDRSELITFDYEKLLKEKNLQNSLSEKRRIEHKIKSMLIFPIIYFDEFYGNIVLQYTQEKTSLSPEQIELLRSVTTQLGIAIYQAQLYEKEKKSAEKERILRELVSETKLLQNLDEIFEHIISKMVNFFQMNRGIGIEIPSIPTEVPLIKYEFIKTLDIKSIKGITVPGNIYRDILEHIQQTAEPYIINDVKELKHITTEDKEFFNNYEIRSFAVIPLARSDEKAEFFGIIGICSSEPKRWTSQELDILRAITATGASIIWEFSKLKEIEELRSTFIMELAHDLQVPLVGEKTAVEFLLKRPDNMPIGKVKTFLDTMASDTNNIINSLKQLINIYDYESGRKKLELKSYSLNDVIKEVIQSLKEQAEIKSISISDETKEQLPNLFIDKEEIRKVIQVILENAVTYTQEGGNIIINSYITYENEVVTCISDNGPGIKSETEKILFQRYAMTKVIERKIGSGQSLYLAKQIIEAHKGKIWYETHLGEGTIFCFLLPT